MIIAKSLESLYQKHKAEILKLVGSEHVANPYIGHLKYETTSVNGNRFYSFPEKMKLPFARMAKGMEYFEWFQNGLSPDEFDKIRNQLRTCLAHIKAKSEEAQRMEVQAGLLLNEMDTRRLKALPYYVLINILANYLIREDERPEIINPTIHAQKCDEIEAELESGNNSFFFNIPQLRRLSEMQSMSPEQLSQYLTELKAEEIALNQELTLYLSMTGAKPAQMTSTKA